MEHNIDFHASTGALGGAGLTHVLPGEQCVLRWRAVKSGVFVYHCAPGGQMIPYHVVHGMNGALMVLPREGLKDGAGNPLSYDKVFYIGEQDFYVPKDENGDWKTYDSPAENFSDVLPIMKTLTPFADMPATGLETWFIRGGSAGAALYTFRQPGVYVYLNHNLIEAVELGAASHVVVEGDWDDGLMKQVAKPAPIPS